MRAALVICFLLLLGPLGCKPKVAVVPPPVSPPSTSGNDCDQVGKELEWDGKAICNEQSSPTHYQQNQPVKIHSRGCKGIHIKHSKDMILYLELYKAPARKACPANPFQNKFPFESGPNHIKEFRTGKVEDSKGTDGCQYELKIKDPETGTCDPHIALEDQ